MELYMVIKSLSDKNRMKIVTLLSKNKYCVKALAAELGISEPAISQHIKILKESGLLEAGDKNGYNVHYSVSKEALAEAGRAFLSMAEEVKPERTCGGRCGRKRKEERK